MDEARERELLEEFVAGQPLPPFGRPAASMKDVARRLRLVSSERDLSLRDTSIDGVIRVVERGGRVLERGDDCISVVVRGGWLRMNRVILTARKSEGQGGAVSLRAVALEGKISQRSAERVLARVLSEIATADRRPGPTTS